MKISIRNFLTCLATVAAANCVEPSQANAQQKAFPTAVGYGQFARGGRGGSVFEVTSLADSGAGSLRACVEASGPRTCVFRVSGTIALDTALTIRNPYLTVAGQTSPGGIQIRAGNTLQGPIYIYGHDIIIRHLRVRTGSTVAASSSVDTISLFPPAHDVILDHVSMSWGPDESLNSYTPNTTIQWSMITETLNRSSHSSGGGHSKGTLVTGQGVTYYRNITAHNDLRNPEFIGGHIDYINNVAYNGGRRAGENYNRYQPGLSMNIVGNFAAVGPNSVTSVPSMDFFVYESLGVNPIQLYVQNNIDWFRQNDSDPQNKMIEPTDRRFLVSAPIRGLSVATSDISGARQAAMDVLAFAGATVPVRDTADARVVNEIRTCTGSIIDDPSQVGGWPVFANVAAPADSDRDGMPDAWESSRGLNTANAADGGLDVDGDGYTNLEEYLNELAGDQNAAGAKISRVGTGTGALPAPNCSRSVPTNPPSAPVHTLTVSGAGQTGNFVEVPAGTAVTVAWNVTSSVQTCSMKYFSSTLNKAVSLNGTSGSFTDVPGNEGANYQLNCLANGAPMSLETVAAKIVGQPYMIDGQRGAPQVVNVSVSKSQIAPGESVTLAWSSPKAQTCVPVINFSNGAVADVPSRNYASTGSTVVTPTQTTTYAVSCLTGSETVGFATVSVSGTPPTNPAPTLSLTATPTSISAGQTSALSWSSTNATSCVGSGGLTGNLALNGTQNVQPSSTTSYTISCTGAGGSISKSVSVAVTSTPPPTAPTLNLSASPTSIAAGQSSTLSWTSTNATSCVGSGGLSGTLAINGSRAVQPTSTSSYTITCTGAGGSIAKTVSVNVGAAPAAFAIGAKVQVTAAHQLRNNPGGSRQTARQVTNVDGLITAGPILQDGQTWWRVDFSLGPDGWTTQSYLKLVP